jgi:hypothetical protein
MKVFWSWQADTAGKTGRHFVRAALADAIEALKQPKEIEEPAERDAREALHLDHDRQGVPGSPDLATTIFRKIEQSAVFVADVTLVAGIQGGEIAGGNTTAKKLINSNVAIEYGYAYLLIRKSTSSVSSARSATPEPPPGRYPGKSLQHCNTCKCGSRQSGPGAAMAQGRREDYRNALLIAARSAASEARDSASNS